MSDWTIVTGDCIEEMGRIEPGSVRLIFADPPYNEGIDYGPHHDDRMSPADYLAWSDRWIRAASPLLTGDGSMWLLCNHPWSARLQLAMEAAGLHHRRTITWYETFGVNCTRKFNRRSRPPLWMTRHPKRFVFNADAPEIRRPSDRQTKYADRRSCPEGKVLDDVWEIPRVAGTHAEREDDFPTQLPLELLRRVVACASMPDDRVLDPFSGSATTGCIGIELGRRYIGIEGSEDWAARSRTRLEHFRPSPPLPPIPRPSRDRNRLYRTKKEKRLAVRREWESHNRAIGCKRLAKLVGVDPSWIAKLLRQWSGNGVV